MANSAWRHEALLSEKKPFPGKPLICKDLNLRNPPTIVEIVLPSCAETMLRLKGRREENFTATHKFKQNTIEVAGERKKGNSEKSTLNYATNCVQTSNASTSCLTLQLQLRILLQRNFPRRPSVLLGARGFRRSLLVVAAAP